MDDGDGILAIWHDCTVGSEDSFEHWYQSEHLVERVSVPGFRVGRRYEAIEGDRQYFTYYEVDSPDVLTSGAYVDRLNDPTPLTKQIMSGIFVRPSRTVCRRTHHSGAIEGSIVVTGVAMSIAELESCQSELSGLPRTDGIANVQVWSGVEDASDVGSREQQLRGGDETIAGCIMVSALRKRDAEAVSEWMRSNTAVKPEQVGTYRLLCQLHELAL